MPIDPVKRCMYAVNNSAIQIIQNLFLLMWAGLLSYLYQHDSESQQYMLSVTGLTISQHFAKGSVKHDNLNKKIHYDTF